MNDDLPEHPGTPAVPAQAEETGMVRAVPRTGGRVGGFVTALLMASTVGLVMVAWLGGLLRGPPGLLVLAVTFLPYLALGLFVASFGAWTAFPDRSIPPMLLLAQGMLGALLWGPAWPSRAEEAAGQPLRVMTWNVRRLWGGPVDGGDPTSCVARRVAEEDPDVVGLLEVSAGDVEVLASRLDLHCVHSDYTGSGSRNTGGLAVCVRTGGSWTFSKGWADRFVDGDDWYYATAEIEGEGRRVNLVAVHLLPYSFRPSWLLRGREDGPRLAARGLFDLFEAGEQVSRGQAGQVRALLDRVSAMRDPTVVVGDFNSTRDAHLHRALRQRLQDTWEQGGQGFGATVRFADRVPLRIDYIYATPDFAVSRATVGERDCSDHAPVVSDVVLRGR